MTRARRLVPASEVREALDIARAYGVEIGAIDIRADGVTIHPRNASPGAPETDFDRWLSQEQDRDGSAHRQ